MGIVDDRRGRGNGLVGAVPDIVARPAPDGHAGYEDIDVRVHLVTDAARADVEALHAAVISTSPVGQTLQRPARLRVALVAA